MPSEPEDAEEVSSILCEPSNAPVHYHWYFEDSELNLVPAFLQLLEPLALGPATITSMLGDFRQRIDQARLASLRPVDQIKGPMSSEGRLDLFEIRFRWDLGEIEELRMRVYHAEPARLRATSRKTVVGLHMHLKNTSSAVDVQSEQDAQIRIAADRYFQGQPKLWGLQNPH